METFFQETAVAAAYSGLLRYRHTCRKYPDTTENVYSATLYPYISRALGYMTSLARGVSVSECVVLGLIVAAIVLVIVFIVKLFPAGYALRS